MSNTKISEMANGNPALSADVIPIDRSGTNYSVTAGSVASLAGPAGPILTASVTVTEAQLTALKITPIQIVAAPGAGSFINVISVVFNKTAGGFAAATTAYVVGFSESPESDYQLTTSSNFIQNSSSVVTTIPLYLFGGVVTGGQPPVPVSRLTNLPLYVMNAGSADVTGSGSITLTATVLYTIVSIS